MNDSTTPGCLCNYGNPTFSNGPCNKCSWREVCEKGAEMNKNWEMLTNEIQGARVLTKF